jgi:hypothetical protein
MTPDKERTKKLRDKLRKYEHEPRVRVFKLGETYKRNDGEPIKVVRLWGMEGQGYEGFEGSDGISRYDRPFDRGRVTACSSESRLGMDVRDVLMALPAGERVVTVEIMAAKAEGWWFEPPYYRGRAPVEEVDAQLYAEIAARPKFFEER